MKPFISCTFVALRSFSRTAAPARLPRWRAVCIPPALVMLGLGLGALGGCGSKSEGSSGSSGAAGKTIGLVLSGYDHQFYKSKDGKEECPDGFVYSSKENWHVQFPTRAARQAQFDRCGAIDFRGPNCEDVHAAPELVKDPLPYREVKGPKSYGANLDGNEDGRETAGTCAHNNFVAPDGTKGIDNQYYRLVGCQRFVRSDLLDPQGVRQAIKNASTLLEISGVDDIRNDAHVEVAIYRPRDPLVIDADNKAVPWQTQRIDGMVPAQRMRGRIVDGELITEPADIVWRNHWLLGTATMLVRGTQLRLRLTDAGAEGVRTGYVDANNIWIHRLTVTAFDSFTQDSPPSFYAALHQLADGYKDPKTGQCTALSSAVKMEFVRVHLRHPSKGAQS